MIICMIIWPPIKNTPMVYILVLMSDQRYLMVTFELYKKWFVVKNSCNNNEDEYIPFWEWKEKIELYCTFAVATEKGVSTFQLNHAVLNRTILSCVWIHFNADVSLLWKQDVVILRKISYSQSIKVKQHLTTVLFTAAVFFFLGVYSSNNSR